MKGVSARLILGVIITVVLILGLAFLISFLSVSFMRATNLKFFADFTEGLRKAATKHEVSMAGLEFYGDDSHQYHILFINETTAVALATDPHCSLPTSSQFILTPCKRTKCICLFEHKPTAPPSILQILYGVAYGVCDDLAKIPAIGQYIGRGCEWAGIPKLANISHVTKSFSLGGPVVYITDENVDVFDASHNMLKAFCDSKDKIRVLECKPLAMLGMLDKNGDLKEIKLKVKDNGIEDKKFAGFGVMNNKLTLGLLKIGQVYDEENNVYLNEFYIVNITAKVG